MKYTLSIKQVTNDFVDRLTTLLEDMGCDIINYSYSSYGEDMYISFDAKDQIWSIDIL
jgi:hypothetical protein